eukprot:1785612-Rhodomonas_salina.1
MDVSDSVLFEDNYARLWGGAIYAIDSDVSMTEGARIVGNAGRHVGRGGVLLEEGLSLIHI